MAINVVKEVATLRHMTVSDFTSSDYAKRRLLNEKG